MCQLHPPWVENCPLGYNYHILQGCTCVTGFRWESHPVYQENPRAENKKSYCMTEAILFLHKAGWSLCRGVNCSNVYGSDETQKIWSYRWPIEFIIFPRLFSYNSFRAAMPYMGSLEYINNICTHFCVQVNMRNKVS